MAGRGGGGGGEETTDEEAFYFPCESSASDGRHEKEEEDGTGEDASFSLWVDRRNLWNPGVPSFALTLALKRRELPRRTVSAAQCSETKVHERTWQLLHADVGSVSPFKTSLFFPYPKNGIGAASTRPFLRIGQGRELISPHFVSPPLSFAPGETKY